jgi:hypothetical protein
MITASAWRGIIGQHLATRLKVPEVMDGLILSPIPQAISADVRKIRFGTERETIERHA